ncbi:minor tail protein [Mycobacterium phage Inca]|uniref:Minor tail protein n=1 Tax=Mycobacterium phage Bask21 TaxID=2902889 RepID=G1D0M5_9CAUD|nr:minor tail protein [Mycobacterium phage Bask21]AEK08324.1 minor tail protein [Mycobacterium phage Bask21]AXH65700.1 minor tail protein [Mycobacterium phage Inca]
MSISMDGNDLIWDGEVRITNFTRSETGVVTLVLTPRGGVGALPVMAQGEPGKPPVIDSVEVGEIPHGEDLPDVEWTLVTPAADGNPPHYTLKFYVHAGEKGENGDNATIIGASDVSGTPADGFILQYDEATQKMVWVASRINGLYVPTSFSTDTAGSAARKQIAYVRIPGADQPKEWRPLVWAQTQNTGTAATRVNLECRIDDPTTGPVVGRYYGIAGATPPPMILIPAFDSATTKVTKSSTYTDIFLVAVQVEPVGDNWVWNPERTTFTVKVDQIK